MNWILYYLYILLRLLVKAVLGIFFSKTTLLNSERLNFDHPAIMVSNHPNTMLDPLNVACRVKKIVFFLANAGMFRNPIAAAILNKLYCIPIERPQDIRPGDGPEKRIKNTESFARCDQFLGGGGCLYIAPEGTSKMERHVRRIKTGTARIALSAENKRDFSLNLAIIPVGVTYSSPTHFRSDVVVNVGTPIRLSDYKEEYAKDSFKTAHLITKEIAEQLKTLSIDTEDEKEDALLLGIDTLQQNQEPLSAEKAFFRSQENLKKLRQIEAEPKEKISKEIAVYFSELEKRKINDQAVYGVKKANWWTLILALPVFLYGWINNFVAFYLPAVLARKLKLYIGYTSTVKVLTSLFTVPIFYGLQTWLVATLCHNTWLTWIYLLSLLPLGWLAWEYRKMALQALRQRRFNQLPVTHRDRLQQQRKELWRDFIERTKN